jgi:hypothetical protein
VYVAQRELTGNHSIRRSVEIGKSTNWSPLDGGSERDGVLEVHVRCVQFALARRGENVILLLLYECFAQSPIHNKLNGINRARGVENARHGGVQKNGEKINDKK